ncbi:ABC transporter substrate-binding protein [Corynebacterium uterequi]|uniref:ABC-type dipeptide transport system, periplasmic component n=1 Tax=Corynebacterium uterequi TaxID=1072256 RepID=A0A0G3HCB6_9CORY|nr:ABC transporter substrate-binding protein [Corynebacterium uterequi]AKK11026.1 ABC-type dipeptide transport system, periplasmic component [Corynebacterium uterequi]
MKFQRSRLIASLAAASLLLTACGGGSGSSTGDSGSTGGGDSEINLGVAYETTNYDPSSTSSALAMGTNWHVMEGLYELNMNDYSVRPALAAGDPTEVSDTELEIALRPEAKFSDGTPVTSADVVESFNRAMAEGNLYASFLSFVDSVEAKDDNTVTVKLAQPFSLAKERLAIVKIVPASSTKEEMTSMPIGTGPWKYEAITDANITAVPNEFYNGDDAYAAKADKMVWDIIKDDTARTTAATSGTIDIMEAVNADNAPLLEAAGFTVEEVDGFNLPFLLFNTTKAPFDKPEVRQAFFYAIDTQKLIDNNMSGKAVAATSFLPESHPNYHKAANVFTHDPEKAKKLLADNDVKDLSVTLLTTDHPWISDMAPQIKADLEAVGIKVNIQSEASQSLYANNLDVEKPTFDLALAPGDPSVFGNDPALLVDWWYGDNVWTTQRTFWQESDPEAWEKLNTLMKESTSLEGDAQQEKWNEAMDLISQEVPLYPLFHRTMITGYNANEIEGFEPIGTTGLWTLGTSTK